MCFIAEGYMDSSTDEMIKILKTAQVVGANMSKDMFIVDRSGVFNSQTDAIKEVIQEELSKRNARFSFEVIANPNFLKA
jgi:UDP-glucose 6-dehydrogenase